jgi:hypothetical protein
LASEAPPSCAERGVAAPTGDVAIFCVVLTDAAGHEGPGDCTAPVAVTVF